MSNNWQAIWQKKQSHPSEDLTLSRLLTLDGYDNFGEMPESSWLGYVGRVAARLSIQPGDTIFDVGCGAGAFLYPWYSRGHTVGGVDYAANMVQIALQAMPGAEIRVSEATAIEVADQFDIVISQGAFLYFPNYEYAAAVLRKMVQKARKSVAILDVPDLAKREYGLALRRGSLGAAEYDRKYRGLDHLYYARDWFAQALADPALKIDIANQNIPGYFHNTYRFNVFIRKSH